MDFIKECLSQLRLRLRLDTAIVEKLEELDRRIYALENNQKLQKEGLVGLRQDLGELKLLVKSERRVLSSK